MSTTEAAPAPAPAVEEVKATETPAVDAGTAKPEETPSAPPTVGSVFSRIKSVLTPSQEAPKEEAKVEETPAAAAEAAPATSEPAAATSEPAAAEVKEESKAAEMGEAAKKEDPAKGPSFLSKLISAVKTPKSDKTPKSEKKPKSPKTPKKGKETSESAASEETPKEGEAAKPMEEAAKPEETPAEPAKETEAAAPVAETSAAAEGDKDVMKEAKEEKSKDKDTKKAKVARRLSSRVTDLFKGKPKAEVSSPPKVDEHPPKIDEPAPVAPLENPATEATSSTAAPETAKPIEPAPAAAPVISAAA